MNPNLLLFQFTVPAIPVAKGRARATIRTSKAGDSFIGNYTPAKTRSFEGVVKLFASQAMHGMSPFTCPIDLLVEFQFPIPPSWPSWKRTAAAEGRVHHTGKPDTSNLVKAIEDACNGVLFHDDGQIVGSVQDKIYTDGAPGILVRGFRRPGATNKAAYTGLVLAECGDPKIDVLAVDRSTLNRRLLSIR